MFDLNKGITNFLIHLNITNKIECYIYSGKTTIKVIGLYQDCYENTRIIKESLKGLIVVWWAYDTDFNQLLIQCK